MESAFNEVRELLQSNLEFAKRTVKDNGKNLTGYYYLTYKEREKLVQLARTLIEGEQSEPLTAKPAKLEFNKPIAQSSLANIEEPSNKPLKESTSPNKIWHPISTNDPHQSEEESSLERSEFNAADLKELALSISNEDSLSQIEKVKITETLNSLAATLIELEDRTKEIWHLTFAFREMKVISESGKTPSDVLFDEDLKNRLEKQVQEYYSLAPRGWGILPLIETGAPVPIGPFVGDITPGPSIGTGGGDGSGVDVDGENIWKIITGSSATSIATLIWSKITDPYIGTELPIGVQRGILWLVTLILFVIGRRNTKREDISWKAVSAGYLMDLAATLFIYSYYRDPFSPGQYFLSSVSTVFAAFISAMIAKRKPVQHGILVVAFDFFLTTILFTFSTELVGLRHYIRMVVSIFAGYSGGYIAKAMLESQKRKLHKTLGMAHGTLES